MKRMGILLALLACLGAGSAHAKTAAGTLITNEVSSTRFFSNLGVEYSVSYSSTVIVLVAQPEVQLYKYATPSLACSGGTVTFCISAINNSAYTSAFNVILDDPFPTGFAYVKGEQELWSSSGSVIMGYSHLHYTSMSCCAFEWNDEPSDGVIGSSASLYVESLVWAISELGPNDSAIMCFKMRLL